MNEKEWQQKWGLVLTTSPQCFAKLPREAYDDLPGVNSSLLKEVIAHTPGHAHEKYNTSNEENEVEERNKKAFLQGSICHCKILEPEELDNRYKLRPTDLPERPTIKQLQQPAKTHTKAGAPTKTYETWQQYKANEEEWKQWESKNLKPGSELVSEDDMKKGLSYAEALLNHPVLGSLYEPTENNRILNELTLTYICPITNLRMKVRIDSLRILSDQIWIGDIKTAQDAGPGEDHFGKAVANFDYEVQAAFYYDAVYFCRPAIEKLLSYPDGTLIMLPIIFEWVAIEKAIPKPQFIGRYFVTDGMEDMENGRKLYQIAKRKVASAMITHYWPAYDTAAQPIVTPYWRKKKVQSFIRAHSEDH